MPHARSTRRPLVAAVTTVLAITLGTGVLAAPAVAAPAAPMAVSAAAPIPFPKNSKLLDAGVKGFMTESSDTGTNRFAWYADGSGTGYAPQTHLRSTRTGDYLVSVGTYQVTVRNLTTMSSFEVPLDSMAPGTQYAGSAADAVFTTRGTALRQHTEDGGTLAVTGLPSGATSIHVAPGTPDDALVRFAVSGAAKWGLLDLATGVVGTIHDSPPGVSIESVSGTHVVWTRSLLGTPSAIFLMDRATGDVQEVPVEGDWGNRFQVRLVGGWVVYGDSGGLVYGPGPLYALTAYNPATKKKVRLLDHLTSSAAAPDGSLYVRGGSLARGEGMYRITATGNSTPTVTLVATTGEPTALKITGNNVPATVDLDKNAGRARFTWNLSRPGAEVTLTMRHIRTGQTQSFYDYPQAKPSTTFDWQGEYNGDYTWTLTARPLNGLGPAATATGGFRVTRTPKPHDFDDNGAPDILFGDGAGRLWRADTLYDTQLAADPRLRVGTGWQIYDRIEATGNLAGSTVGDLVARDRAGALWLYQGNGRGGFAARTKVGAGWQAYDQLAGGSDLTGDGRADLVATDKAGALYLYRGTGSATTPFAARKKIGTGWGIYNQLTATGNLAGGPAGDLVARDRSGVLWLYLGRGDGTFAARTKIGGGWNAYQHIVAVGDADRDSRSDLVGFGAQGEYLHRGTGDWRSPFRGAQLAGLTFGDGPYDSVA